MGRWCAGAAWDRRRRSSGGAACGRETGRQTGQGEAAIAELLARLDEITQEPDDPVLLLYEDSDIASADEVWAAMETAGRTPASNARDQPAPSGSRW